MKKLILNTVLGALTFGIVNVVLANTTTAPKTSFIVTCPVGFSEPVPAVTIETASGSEKATNCAAALDKVESNLRDGTGTPGYPAPTPEYSRLVNSVGNFIVYTYLIDLPAK